MMKQQERVLKFVDEKFTIYIDSGPPAKIRKKRYFVSARVCNVCKKHWL